MTADHIKVVLESERDGTSLHAANIAPWYVSEDLLDSERLFAFMDDIYMSSAPDRTEAFHQSLDRQMYHARIRLHQGKTQFWNRGGVAREGWDRLTAAARTSDPSAVVER